MRNVIVIGSGPAGISAALYTARAGLPTTVITKGEGALRKAEKIENYYGFSDPVSGSQLERDGIEGAKKVGVRFVNAEVVGLGFTDTLTVETTVGSFPAHGVVLATGTQRSAPRIKGLSDFEGKGVSYCAMCDGFFYRGKNVAILGSGAFALHELEALEPVAASVTLLTNGAERPAEFPETLATVTKRIAGVAGTDRLEKLIFDDGTELPVDGLFIAYGVAGSADLARKIGAQTEGSRIVVDEHMATSIPGLYAAGDCTGGMLQVAKAVYEGAQAGASVAKYVRQN